PSSPLCSLSATSTTVIYTLSLHDALPISALLEDPQDIAPYIGNGVRPGWLSQMSLGAEPKVGLQSLREDVGNLVHGNVSEAIERDRKSTRLNSSHVKISYAVFCLKKKNKK